jgi:hypothetical protein
LFTSFCTPLTFRQQLDFEKIDETVVRAMATAEQRCRKLCMGIVEWSPQMQRLRNNIRYIALSKRKLRGRRVGTKILI